jgi:hypothetical protein
MLILHYFSLFQRAFAACRAISALFIGESFAALATPPFKPPSLPSTTAAGFFSALGSTACTLPVACCTTEKAVSFISLLDRLGMAQLCAYLGRTQAESEV